jgi:hypothetical protein
MWKFLDPEAVQVIHIGHRNTKIIYLADFTVFDMPDITLSFILPKLATFSAM